MPQSNYIYATPGSRRNGSIPNEVKPSPTTLLHNFMSYTSYQQQSQPFGGGALQVQENMYNSNSPPAKGRKGYGSPQRLAAPRRPTSPSILSEEQRKYIHQPSYVKFGVNNVVYHQFRQLKLEVESPLLSEEALTNFHQAKVKLFPNTGRELEV